MEFPLALGSRWEQVKSTRQIPTAHGSWQTLPIAFFLLFGWVFALPCPAAENDFEVIPRWVRPGPEATVQIKINKKIDTFKKIFLRLSLRDSNDNRTYTIRDLPLESEQASKGLAEVKITSPMRRGIYSAELVGEGNELFASSPENITVAASEKPSITDIMPRVIYPTEGRFDFEVMGDNFSQYNAEDILIRINDVPVKIGKYLRSGKNVDVDSCKNEWPCLISHWRTLQVFGLSLDKQPLIRPLALSIEVDKLISDPRPIVLSCVQRYTPVVISFATLGLTAFIVYCLCRRKIGRRKAEDPTFTTMEYLLLEPQTNTYSLAKFQMLIWSAAAVLAYSYISASQFLVQWKWLLPKVPDGLPMLLGLSATTSVLSIGATEFRGSKGAGPVGPGIGDFIASGEVFAPERLQLFVWTILGAIGFVAATLAQDPGTVTKMAEIPENFNSLMGASSLGYLAGKFIRKPGPVIKSLEPGPPYTAPAFDLSKGIRIIGEKLSPKARVMLNNVPLKADQVTVPEKSKDAEFVSELIVKPTFDQVNQAVSGVAFLKVINPDGQCAEK